MKILKKIIPIVVIFLLVSSAWACSNSETTETTQIDIKSVFEKAAEAELDNAAFTSEVTIESEDTNAKMTMSGVFDFLNNEAVIKTEGEGILSQNTTIYLVDDKVYIINPVTNQWQYTQSTSNLINKGLFVASDEAYDLMTVTKVGDNYVIKSNEPILLSKFQEVFNYEYNLNYGSVIDTEILQNSMIEFEYVLNKDFYPVKMATTSTVEISDTEYKTSMNMEFKGHNQQDPVTLPSEAKNAVEVTF